MPHTATGHGRSCGLELAIPHSEHWLGHEVKIGKSRSSANEGSSADDAHLQTGILGDDTACHQCGQVCGSPEGQETIVADHTEHHLYALLQVDIVANVEHLLLPIVDKLIMKGVSTKYVNLIEYNLKELLKKIVILD